MFKLIHKMLTLFATNNSGNDKQYAQQFVWCLVGNVVAEHTYGEQKEMMRGSKHFTPGTKVYCMPVKWGDGYKNITVIGKLRKSRRLITIIMPSAHITNWRVSKVYGPKLLSLMQKAGGWTNSEEDYETIVSMAKHLNGRA